MKNLLNSVKISAPKSSVFDLSHDVKLSGNMGNLIPVMIMDCVPGDRITLATETLCRLAPMVAPMMHRVDITQHTFAIPKRLLWPNWENYITNTPVEGVLPAHPYFIHRQDGTGGYVYTKLADYMGLPKVLGANQIKVNPMFFSAYQFVWQEYYRDQNLQTGQDSDWLLQDGLQDATLVDSITQMRKRCWEHDYFTSALPFAQKGAAVEIPVAGDVTFKNGAQGGQWVDPTTGTLLVSGTMKNESAFGRGSILDDGAVTHDAAYDPRGTLEVANVNTTINDLRKAYALQRFLEKMARYGSRYTELLRGVFNVQSSDKRLQRPEYVIGTKSPIVISEVLNNTGTEDAPQGAMAGHGISVGGSEFGTYFCEEHCILITVMSIMPKTAYQQGIPKMFLKTTDPFEHFFPDFDHIGEQEILNEELYVDSANPNGTFGYTPRYCEYKFMGNRVAGDFRDTLDFWHMGRIFQTEPSLNEQFVAADPTHRVFAVTDPDQDKLWIQVVNKIYARRLMSKYSTPTF